MDTNINSGTNLALQRLMTWLSPAFPVGAFAYSAGLETTIADQTIGSPESLSDWLAGALRFGTALTDGILLAEAYRGETSAKTLAELSDICRALCPSAERIAEMDILGGAFIEAAKAWPNPVLDRLPRPTPYPIAVGAIAGAHAIGLTNTLIAYLTAFTHSQISVAVRLVPLGQAQGLSVLADLEPLIAEAAADISTLTLADIGSISHAADIAAMAHETLDSRVFRS